MAMAALPDNLPEARVLVVDDETNIVELLSVSLKFQGFEVHTASNGPAALDKAREVRPDAVILDVMMPGMDGFGLLRRLRDQAVFPGRGGCPAAGDPAPIGPWRRGAPQCATHLRRHRTRRGHPRSLEGRRAGFAVADGVHAAAVLHHQRGHRALQAEDPRPRMAL